MTNDLNSNGLVHRDPEIMGGKPVFVGTRVPVKTLFDYLEAGDSIDGFLHSFPTVQRKQVIGVLEISSAAVNVVADASRQRIP